MNSGRGHACHDQSILFFWWIVTVLIRLDTEPVSIKLVESERFVQCTGIVISLYNLKVCILRTFLYPFFQKSGTDLACIAVFAIFFFYMDGIDPDVSLSRMPSPVAMIWPFIRMQAQIVSLRIA